MVSSPLGEGWQSVRFSISYPESKGAEPTIQEYFQHIASELNKEQPITLDRLFMVSYNEISRGLNFVLFEND